MFSTMVGSALHGVLPPLQPAHGKITRLRVYSMRLKRPIQTRFRSGSPSLVNLATYRNSLAHSSKGTPSRPPEGDDALTDCEPTVSGTISLPSRGTFHLSLTVLVHYRSSRTYLALRGGPRRFTPAFTGPALLGNTDQSPTIFRVRGHYPLWRDVPKRFH